MHRTLNCCCSRFTIVIHHEAKERIEFLSTQKSTENISQSTGCEIFRRWSNTQGAINTRTERTFCMRANNNKRQRTSSGYQRSSRRPRRWEQRALGRLCKESQSSPLECDFFSLSLVSLTATIFAPFIIIIILTLSMQEDISELAMKVIQSLD